MEAKRNLWVDGLAIAFGISSWVEISGLGVQMPLMVQTLPEKWKLGSYIVVVTQLANIGPIIYSFARKYKSHKVMEIPTIHVTLAIALISCLLLSFFWDRTSYIARQEHSTALLILAFCLAMVDCTSSVLYLPFMANFRAIYVVSCMIGEGACGLFPALVGFAQGIGGKTVCKNVTFVDDQGHNVTELIETPPEPRFSVSAYFVVLSVMVMLSWIAFVLLNKWPKVQSERVSEQERHEIRMDCSSPIETTHSYDSLVIQNSYLSNRKRNYKMLLGIQTYICVLQNGILSSIQAFSCMPYGSLTYHLSVNLSLISNPLGCVIALFLPMWKLKSVFMVTLFSTCWGAYILAMGLLSPNPPLMNSFGSFLVILSWVMHVGIMSYIKAVIVAILRGTEGNRGLFLGGALSQLGSASGGILMFIIVNYTNAFQSKSAC